MAEAIAFLALQLFAVELTAATAAAIAFAATLALNVGLAVLLRPRPKREAAPDNTRNFTLERGPRIFVTGRALVGGNVVFRDAIKSPSELWQAVVHCEGPVRVERTLIEDADALFGGLFNRQFNIPGVGLNNRYSVRGPLRVAPASANPAVEMRIFDGDPGQAADSRLIAAFPNAWTSDHRLRGICYSSVRFRPVSQQLFNQIYRGGNALTTRQVVMSLQTYNVRGNADPADMTTWGESRNASDAIASLFLRPREAGGFGLPADVLDLDGDFRSFASVCDRVQTGPDGITRPLWCIDGSWSANDDPRDTLARMQRACAAEVYEKSTGKIGIRGGRWQEPMFRFDASHIVGVELEQGADAFTAVTTMRITWSSLDHRGAKIPGADVARDDLIDAAGGEEVFGAFDNDFVVSHAQLRHLAWIELNRINAPWRGKVTTDLSALAAWDDPTVEITVEPLGIDGMAFRIIEREKTGDLIEWTVEATARSDWDPPEWADPPELPPTTDAKPGAPVIMHPEYFVMRTGPDGSGTTQLRFYCERPRRPECMALIEYWKSGSATVVTTTTPAGNLARITGTFETIRLEPGEIFATVDGIPAGETWLGWARIMTPETYTSEWTSGYNPSTDATTPAQIVTSLTATAPALPNGEIAGTTTTLPASSPVLYVEARAPDDWDVRTVEFYYTVNSPVFATTNPIGVSQPVDPHMFVAVEVANFMTTGNTYRFWARFRRVDLSYTTPVVSANVTV